MSTDTVLTDTDIEQGRHKTFSTENPFCPCDSKTFRKAARWAEQAVLQSPEVQALRKDAEAFRLMVSFRLTVKVDEVCSDVEVFHLGECLAWPPAHHCENDEEVAIVAREAIQKAVATLKEQP